MGAEVDFPITSEIVDSIIVHLKPEAWTWQAAWLNLTTFFPMLT